MREIIKSNANKTIKFIKSLQMKKYRDEQDKFIIEGEKLMDEALRYMVPISMVMISQSFAESSKHDEYSVILRERKIPMYYSEDSIFKGVCETHTPKGIIAVVEKPEYDFDNIISKDKLSIILLHELRDPGNVGTIIRTADACGMDAVLISKESTDIYNGKTIRATMGSLFHIPVIQGLDTLETIDKLKKRETVIIGADPHNGINCTELPHYRKWAVIVGNESRGINNEINDVLDIKASIPMPGSAESLNAGIAASILMYEFSVRNQCL